MSQGLDKEYAGIAGYQEFCDAAVALAFGKDSSQVKNKLVRPESRLGVSKEQSFPNVE